LVASVLQIVGTVDFWSLLILPLNSILSSSISVYYVVLFIVVLIILSYSFIKLRGRRENILDHLYGRRIAILCQTPRTTQYLRQRFEEWNRGVIGGYGFENYIKDLEKQGYLIYRNEKWETTDKALDYLEKYSG